MGNGKSFLCSGLAAICSYYSKQPVIILIKSPYLLYRDYNKFKHVIQSCNVSTSYKEFIMEGVTFMDEKAFLSFAKKKKNENINII
jgi:hypothetical protein